MKSAFKKVKQGAVRAVVHRGRHKAKKQNIKRHSASLDGSKLPRRSSSFDSDIIATLFNAVKRQVSSMDCKDLLVGALLVFLFFVVFGAALCGLLLVLSVILIVIVGGVFVVSLLTGSTISVWR